MKIAQFLKNMVFGLHISIDSNSEVSNNAQNFFDRFPHYLRTPCSAFWAFGIPKYGPGNLLIHFSVFTEISAILVLKSNF